MADHTADVIAEIDAQLEILLPQYEGLQDYDRLNIQEPTRSEVRSAISIFSTRIQWLNYTKAALQGLQANGYPTLPTFSVSGSIMLDLQDNAKTIEAALTTFTSNEAATMGLTAGQPTPKAT